MREAPETSGTAALIAAIDAADEPRVRDILAKTPAAAAARDDAGVSATMHALYRGHRDLAEIIAAALPELDLFEAAALGRLDRVMELVGAEPASVTNRSADGFTALHYPAFFGVGDAAAVTRTLLEAGADVNARSENDFSVLPLHSAVAGGHGAVVALLVDAGADVNARQRHGFTPLHGAAQNGVDQTVDRLLAAGADRTDRNDDGKSAADIAAEAGHVELASRLR